MTVDYYNVGGFIFSVSLPQGVDAGSLLPSFNPFRCEAVQPEQCLFRITAQEHPQVPSGLGGDLLDESVNDLGYTSLFAVSDGYRVEIRHTSRAAIHHLQADSRFTSAVATVFWEDCHAGSVLCSMIRIVIHRRFCFMELFPFMLRLSAILDMPIFLWARAGQGRALMQPCG